MDQKRILLVGSTGRMGRYIIKPLLHQNFRLRALVRDKTKAQKILGPGVELVEGNLQRVRDIQTAMQGVDGLFINLGINPFETEKDWHALNEGMKYLLVSARINQVQHIISHGLLAFTDNQRQSNSSWRVNLYKEFFNLLSKGGLPFTYFRTSLFMENFLERFRKGNDIRIHINSENPISFLSATDLGKEISKAFFDESYHGQSPLILGREQFFLVDAAKKFIEARQEEKLNLINRESNFFQLLSKLRPGMEEEIDWFQQVKAMQETELLGMDDVKIKTQTRFADFLESISNHKPVEKKEKIFQILF